MARKPGGTANVQVVITVSVDVPPGHPRTKLRILIGKQRLPLVIVERKLLVDELAQGFVGREHGF